MCQQQVRIANRNEHVSICLTTPVRPVLPSTVMPVDVCQVAAVSDATILSTADSVAAVPSIAIPVTVRQVVAAPDNVGPSNSNQIAIRQAADGAIPATSAASRILAMRDAAARLGNIRTEAAARAAEAAQRRIASTEEYITAADERRETTLARFQEEEEFDDLYADSFREFN